MLRKSTPRKRGPAKPKATAELAAWIDQQKPAAIGEPEWEALHRLLAPISDSYLRRLLRNSGIRLAPLVEGVRQESFQALEASLVSLLGEYEHADSQRRLAIRRLVIAARDHARWALRVVKTNDAKRAEKEEMILWMMTWLENPPLFPEWVQLRRLALAANDKEA